MTNQTCDTEKLREIFARGLVSGLGDANQTCIEGAIALACGGDLSDSPPCVANAAAAALKRVAELEAQ